MPRFTGSCFRRSSDVRHCANETAADVAEVESPIANWPFRVPQFYWNIELTKPPYNAEVTRPGKIRSSNTRRNRRGRNLFQRRSNHSPRRRDSARTEQRMACQARPLHDSGKHRADQRWWDHQAVRSGRLIDPAIVGKRDVQGQFVAPRLGIQSASFNWEHLPVTTTNPQCWICGNPVTTGEHKAKHSDVPSI